MDPEETYSAYQAPGVDHLDEGPELYQPRVFAFQGRIGRARFVAYSWWATFVVGLVFGLLLIVVGGLLAGRGYRLSSMPAYQEGLMFPWMFAMGLLTYVPVLVMAKRRLNDLNLSGWLVVLVFVPFVNVLLFLYLMFWPGQESVNRYGPPAVRNSLPVWLFGVGLPLLVFVLFATALLAPLFVSQVFWGSMAIQVGS